MTRILVILVVLVLALGLVARPAVAKPDAAALKKANAHFKLGQEFFKAQQWDRAIVEYQAALDLSGEPLMVFNIALAHDRAGRAEAALDGFRRYLDLAPDGAIADEAREDVIRLTPIVDKVHADRAAEAARVTTAAAQAKADADRRAAAARQALIDRERMGALAARATALHSRARVQRYGGLALAVAGLAAVGVGITYGLEARSIADDLTRHEGAWTEADLAHDADGHAANTRFLVFSSLGAAALLGGGGLYLLGRHTDHRADDLQVTLTITPRGAGITGRF